MSRDRLYTWAGLWRSPSSSWEALRLEDDQAESQLRAPDERSGLPYQLDYRLRWDADWHLREAVFHVESETGVRKLHLLADGRGHWQDGDGEALPASYGAIALGAPLGVLLVQWLGLWSMGASIVLLGALGFALAWPKLPAPLVHGERLPFHHVLGRVTPHGMGLALGAIGFGTIATFITLYYASRGRANAVLCLSAFGGCFIGARLLFANSINRLGGFRVAIICLGVESLGLLLLWSAPNPWVGLAGAALTGFGFSLVFPAFGVEAVNLVPASNRGAALGAYSLFVDLSLGITGPLVGFVANLFGFRSMFLFACLASLGGLALAVALHRRSRRPG